MASSMLPIPVGKTETEQQIKNPETQSINSQPNMVRGYLIHRCKKVVYVFY